MNIGIDVRCLMQKNYSGVPEYTYNLLNNLFLLDRKNNYKLFYNSQKPVEENLPQFNFNNVKYFGFHYPNKLLNFCFKFIHLPKIDKLIRSVEHMLLPNFNFFALSNNCQAIMTVHDLSFIYFPEFYSNRRNLWLRLINPKKINAANTKLIADSKNTKNDLIELFNIKDNKIEIIHLGVDHNYYRKLSPDNPNLKLISTRYSLPEKFILFLGTLEPRKNIISIIEAFNLLKTKEQYQDLHLVLAGAKGWKYEPIFETANNSPFSDQIHYLDYIRKEDKVYLYNLAQLFVFPSYYEGFGLPALEAQACGLPVIASATSSFPEILGNSALLIHPANIRELALAADELLTNAKLRAEYINSGIANSQKFSWQKCAQKTLAYLNS